MYSNHLKVDFFDETTIKAIALKTDFTSSQIVVGTYIIDLTDPTIEAVSGDGFRVFLADSEVGMESVAAGMPLRDPHIRQRHPTPGPL